MCRAGEELEAHYEQLIYWVVKTNNEIEPIRKIKYNIGTLGTYY